MSCDAEAVLLVTRQVEGTSTHVARQRFELRCCRETGHPGPHRDQQHEQDWEDVSGRKSMVLRDEEEG